MAHQSAGTSPVVLLLQDPLIIIDWTKVLEDAGIKVLSAGSFKAASMMLSAEQGITHLVSDVGVHLGPSVSELLELLNARRSPLRVIVTSDKTPEMSDLPTDTILLRKPVQPYILIDAIRV